MCLRSFSISFLESGRMDVAVVVEDVDDDDAVEVEGAEDAKITLLER